MSYNHLNLKSSYIYIYALQRITLKAYITELKLVAIWLCATSPNGGVSNVGMENFVGSED